MHRGRVYLSLCIYIMLYPLGMMYTILIMSMYISTCVYRHNYVLLRHIYYQERMIKLEFYYALLILL